MRNKNCRLDGKHKWAAEKERVSERMTLFPVNAFSFCCRIDFCSFHNEQFNEMALVIVDERCKLSFVICIIRCLKLKFQLDRNADLRQIVLMYSGYLVENSEKLNRFYP